MACSIFRRNYLLLRLAVSSTVQQLWIPTKLFRAEEFNFSPVGPKPDPRRAIALFTGDA